MKQALIIIILPIIYLLFLTKLVSFYAADLYATQSKVLLKERDFIGAHDAINKAIQANDREPAYLRQKAKVFLAQKILVQGEDALTLSKSALKQVEQAENLNPKNLATLRNDVPLYHFMLVEDSTEMDQYVKDYYSRMKATYSNDLGMLVDIAENEKKAGFIEDYEYTRSMVEKLRPELLEWHSAFY